MQATSELWKIYFARGERFQYRLNVAGEDYFNEDIHSITFSGGTLTSDSVMPGGAVCQQLDVVFRPRVTAPKMACVKLSVRMDGDLGPTEWLDKGTFFTDTRSCNGKMLTLNCFDSMLKAEKDAEGIISYGLNMPQAAETIARVIGTGFDPSGIDPLLCIGSVSGMTLREAAGYIAMANGGCFIISDTNALKLVTPAIGVPVLTLEGMPYKSFSADGEFFTVTGVQLFSSSNDETGFISGGGDNMLQMENPWASQSMADTIFAKIGGRQHLPCRLGGLFLDPAVELGDTIRVTVNGEHFEDRGLTGMTAVNVPLMSVRAYYMASVSYDVESHGEGGALHEYYGKGTFRRALDAKLEEDSDYYGVTLGGGYGLKIKRSDGVSETVFNSDAWYVSMNGKKVLYADYASVPPKFVFDGELSAETMISETVITNNLYAQGGAIANLTVNRLRSDWIKPWKYLSGDAGDVYYLDAHDEELLFMLDQNGSGASQYTNMDGKPLWWKDGEIGGSMTTDLPEDPETEPVPVMVFGYDTVVPGSWRYEHVMSKYGMLNIPVITMGVGDNDGHGKLRMYKDADGVYLSYTLSEAVGDNPKGSEVGIRITNAGVEYFNMESGQYELVGSSSGSSSGEGGGHLVLDHQPTRDEIQALPDGAVVLVYDGSKPYTPPA